jgi:hypothetical protein
MVTIIYVLPRVSVPFGHDHLRYQHILAAFQKGSLHKASVCSISSPLHLAAGCPKHEIITACNMLNRIPNLEIPCSERFLVA